MRAAHSLIFIFLCALGACERSAGTVDLDLSLEGADLSTPALPSYDLACVGFTAQSKLVPVSLVFLVDKSGSMGDGINGDPTLKWQPVTQALQAFFEDPSSKGVSASLQYFPLADQCNPSAYYSQAVSMRPLPDLSFATSMSGVTPNGSTPTRPAVLGAIDYARDTHDLNPSERTAIVLVTDGEPDTCSSSVPNVALELGKVAASTPTYVIGVGDNLSSLNQLAQSGGTGSPTVVAVGDPTTTKMQFLAALDAIRGLVLTCNFPVPAAPVGMTIDYAQVNVTFTPSAMGSVPSLLPYDKDCSSGLPGWKYDDPANPKEVQLCAPSCDAARSDRDGRIDLLFGCSTVGDPIS